MGRIRDGEIEVKAVDFLTVLIKDAFGTFFIEDSKFPFLQKKRFVGRTFFADRIKQPAPINPATADRLVKLYREVLNGEANCDTGMLTEILANKLGEMCMFDIQFLKFFSDDNNRLTIAKTTGWLTLLERLTYLFIDVSSISIAKLKETGNLISIKAIIMIKDACKGTYTDSVIQKWENKYTDIRFAPYGTETKKEWHFKPVPLFLYSFAGAEVRNLTKALLDEYIMDFVSVKMITDRTDIKPHHNVGGMGSMFNEYIFIDKEDFDNRIREDDIICVASDSSNNREGYSKEYIDGELADRKIVCIAGDFELYSKLKKYYPHMISVLILPYDESNIISVIKQISPSEKIQQRLSVKLIQELQDIIELDKEALYIRCRLDFIKGDIQYAVRQIETRLSLAMSSVSNNEKSIRELIESISNQV